MRVSLLFIRAFFPIHLAFTLHFSIHTTAVDILEGVAAPFGPAPLPGDGASSTSVAPSGAAAVGGGGGDATRLEEGEEEKEEEEKEGGEENEDEDEDEKDEEEEEMLEMYGDAQRVYNMMLAGQFEKARELRENLVVEADLHSQPYNFVFMSHLTKYLTLAAAEIGDTADFFYKARGIVNMQLEVVKRAFCADLAQEVIRN